MCAWVNVNTRKLKENSRVCVSHAQSPLSQPHDGGGSSFSKQLQSTHNRIASSSHLFHHEGRKIQSITRAEVAQRRKSTWTDDDDLFPQLRHVDFATSLVVKHESRGERVSSSPFRRLGTHTQTASFPPPFQKIGRGCGGKMDWLMCVSLTQRRRR